MATSERDVPRTPAGRCAVPPFRPGGLSMGELLASCAAAAAVSTPPPAPAPAPVVTEERREAA